MTAWAWHQLVHLLIVACLIGIGFGLAHGAATLIVLLTFGVVWFAYRAHVYHHAQAKTGVGDHD